MEEDQLLGDSNKRERREERRSEKERALRREKIIRLGKKYGIIALIILAVGTGVFLIVRKISQGQPEALGPDLSRSVPNEGQEHMKEGDKNPNYKTNPPTSGAHWPDPLRDGLYDTSKPDEAAVHALEHGRIWISYKSSVPDSTKKRLKDMLKGERFIVLTVRDSNESDIALAAWTRIDTFNINSDGSFDEKRIRDFIRRYRDKGPESVPMMTGKEY